MNKNVHELFIHELLFNCFMYKCLHLSNVITVGHGRSGGERVMINTFDTFIDDVFTHLDEVKKEYPDIPVHVFGHSMVGEEKSAIISLLFNLSKVGRKF